MNMNFKRKLPIPKEIKEMYPLSEYGKSCKEANDEELKAIFDSKSDKFILIIGPCSADREDAMIEYGNIMKGIQEKVKDKIKIVLRVYTNKPRSKGSGYKGMLHQPDVNKEENMLKGLIAIRKLHMKLLNDTGLPIADEMLYPENHRYLSDILSYVAVGARSVEDQQHRMTASGLDIPVGMKNPMSGDLKVLLNSIMAAKSPQEFIYRGWEVESTGNPYTHAILRGYVNLKDECIPNYKYDDLVSFCDMYEAKSNPSIIVDCNHANSAKQYEKQVDIALDVIDSMKRNEKIRKCVKGLMIESYLKDGSQHEENGEYGLSITDPCLGIEKTEKLIYKIYDELKTM